VTREISSKAKPGGQASQRDFSGENWLNILFRAQRAVVGRLRGALYRRARFFAPGSGRGLFFGKGARFINPRAVWLGDGVAFGRDARIECFDVADGSTVKLRIGKGTTFGDGCHIGCSNSIEFGEDVLLGSHVLVVDHSHGSPGKDLRSHEMQPPRLRPVISKGPIVVERLAWIGDGVVVLPGVRVGEGAVIGANAVVRTDVPAWTIFIGKS